MSKFIVYVCMSYKINNRINVIILSNIYAIKFRNQQINICFIVFQMEYDIMKTFASVGKYFAEY